MPDTGGLYCWDSGFIFLSTKIAACFSGKELINLLAAQFDSANAEFPALRLGLE
jgi:hypothetical protein